MRAVAFALATGATIPFVGAAIYAVARALTEALRSVISSQLKIDPTTRKK